jgi:hypothetical protein
MPHATPLLPPSLLTPRAVRLASSSLALCHVGAMHWHAHAHSVALSSATPCPTHYPDADVRIKLLRCRLFANPLSCPPPCTPMLVRACSHCLSTAER